MASISWPVMVLNNDVDYIFLEEVTPLAKAEIAAGACGFTTTVEATSEGRRVHLTINSDCKAIQQLAEHLLEVDPMSEISFRKGMPKSLEAGATYCIHSACPVPVGIIKAVELAAGMNLPVDATIKLSK